jgi:hypothetical protein
MSLNEAIEILTTGDEAALRELQMPQPESQDDLVRIFTALSERQHDYGTCVYAMSIYAEAAFNLMASKMGVTGFQASCADMDILKRTRRIKGPFAIIDGADLLYPQYDIPAKVAGILQSWQAWASTEAVKLLGDKHMAHPDVMAHWERLAAESTTTTTAAETPTDNVEAEIK